MARSYIVKPNLIMTVDDIVKEVRPSKFMFVSKIGTLKWLAKRQLIKNTVVCNDCQTLMRLCEYKNQDGYRWACDTCLLNQNVREGSFLSKSNLNIAQILNFISNWLSEIPNNENAEKSGIFVQQTIGYWASFCREICVKHVMRNPPILGGLNEVTGEGLLVVIGIYDMKRFSVTKNGFWIIAAIELGSNKFIVLPIANYRVSTFLSLIKFFIRERTCIILNAETIYLGISKNAEYHEDGIMYENRFFLYIRNNVILNYQLQRIWNRLNNKIPRDTTIKFISLYINELIWRNKLKQGKHFGNFLCALLDLYPVH